MSLVATALMPNRSTTGVPSPSGGLATVVQVVPSQCVKMWVLSPNNRLSPEDQTSSLATAAMANRFPASSGDGTSVHSLPSQCMNTASDLLSPTAHTSSE